MLGNEMQNYRPTHTEIQIQMNVHIITDSPGEIQYHSGFIAGGKMQSAGSAIVNGPRPNMIQPSSVRGIVTPTSNPSLDSGIYNLNPSQPTLSDNLGGKDAAGKTPDSGALIPAQSDDQSDPSQNGPKIVPLNTSMESLSAVDHRPQSVNTSRVKLPETDVESVTAAPPQSDGEASQKSNRRNHHHHHHRHRHKCKHRAKGGDLSDSDLNSTMNSDKVAEYLNSSKQSEFAINSGFARSPDDSFADYMDDSFKNKALLAKYAQGGGLGAYTDFIPMDRSLKNITGGASLKELDEGYQIRKALQKGSPTSSEKQINDVIKQLTQNLGIVPMGGTGTTVSRSSSVQDDNFENFQNFGNFDKSRFPGHPNNISNYGPIAETSPDDELSFNQNLVVRPTSDLNLIAEIRSRKQPSPVNNVTREPATAVPHNYSSNTPQLDFNWETDRRPFTPSSDIPNLFSAFDPAKNAINLKPPTYFIAKDFYYDQYYVDPITPKHSDNFVPFAHSSPQNQPMMHDVGAQIEPPKPVKRSIDNPLKFDVGVQGTILPSLQTIEFEDAGVQTGVHASPMIRKSLINSDHPSPTGSGYQPRLISTGVGSDSIHRDLSSGTVGVSGEPTSSISRGTISTSTIEVQTDMIDFANPNQNQFDDFGIPRKSVDSGDTGTPSTENGTLTREDTEPLRAQSPTHSSMIIHQQAPLSFRRLETTPVIYQEFIDMDYPSPPSPYKIDQDATINSLTPTNFHQPEEAQNIKPGNNSPIKPTKGGSRPPEPPPLPPHHRIHLPPISSNSSSKSPVDNTANNYAATSESPIHDPKGVQNIVAEFELRPDAVIPLPSRPFYRDFAGRSSFVEKEHQEKMPNHPSTQFEPRSNEKELTDINYQPSEQKPANFKNNGENWNDTQPKLADSLGFENYDPHRAGKPLSFHESPQDETKISVNKNSKPRLRNDFPEVSSFLKSLAEPHARPAALPQNRAPAKPNAPKVEMPSLSKAPYRRYPEKPYFTESIPDKPNYSADFSALKPSFKSPEKPIPPPPNPNQMFAANQPKITEITTSKPKFDPNIHQLSNHLPPSRKDDTPLSALVEEDMEDLDDTPLSVTAGFADISYSEDRIFGVPLATIPEAATPSDRSSCDFEPFVIPILDHEPRRYVRGGDDVIVGSRGMVNNFIQSNPESCDGSSDSSATVIDDAADEDGDKTPEPPLKYPHPLDHSGENENLGDSGGNAPQQTRKQIVSKRQGLQSNRHQHLNDEQFQIRLYGPTEDDGEETETRTVRTETVERVEQNTTFEEFETTYKVKQTSPSANRRNPTLLELTKMLQEYEKSDGELPLIDDIVDSK